MQAGRTRRAGEESMVGVCKAQAGYLRHTDYASRHGRSGEESSAGGGGQIMFRL